MSIKGKIGRIARKLIPMRIYIKIRSFMLAPKLNHKLSIVRDKKNKLHQMVVMGDSHSRFFSGATPETETMIHFDSDGSINYDAGDDKRFCAFDLGPALAFSLNKRGTTVRALEKYKWLSKHLVCAGEPIIFAFGEIDIRAHVFKHVSQDNPYTKVISSICDNYEEFLSIVEADGYYPIVWGPIASQKDIWKEKAQNPAVGSECERNKAVEFFNTQMKERCESHGWVFFTIYDETMDSNYMTKGEYIYDMCHLGNNAKELFEPRYEVLLESIKIRRNS